MSRTYSRSCNGLTEHQEQALVYSWRKIIVDRLPILALLHAIPNGAKLPYRRGRGGQRYSPEAMKLKAEGLTPGMLDNNLPVPRRNYCGLWVEMKVGKNTLTDEQEQIKKLLESEGNYVAVCYSYQEMIAVIEWYLDFKSIDYGIVFQGSY